LSSVKAAFDTTCKKRNHNCTCDVAHGPLRSIMKESSAQISMATRARRANVGSEKAANCNAPLAAAVAFPAAAVP